MSSGVTIGTTCPRCGDVELCSDQMWLVLASVPASTHFGFHCPQCAHQVRHRANAEVVSALAWVVPVEELIVPAEALETHDGPPLTPDDLLDFALALTSLSEHAVVDA